jgi:hypothetical protein
MKKLYLQKFESVQQKRKNIRLVFKILLCISLSIYVDTFGYFLVVILFFQDYILTKHANLRNYVCIGNEDNHLLDIDDMYGRQ